MKQMKQYKIFTILVLAMLVFTNANAEIKKFSDKPVEVPKLLSEILRKLNSPEIMNEI